MSREWEEHAACRDADPEVFFADSGDARREAKRICSWCPVRAECLLDTRDGEKPGMRFGIRAGLSAYARDRLWRRVQTREAA